MSGKTLSSKEINHKTTPTNSNVFLNTPNKSVIESSPVVSNNNSMNIINSINKNLYKQQENYKKTDSSSSQQQFNSVQPTEKASQYIEVASKNSLNTLAQKLKNIIGTDSMGTLTKSSEMSANTLKDQRKSRSCYL